MSNMQLSDTINKILGLIQGGKNVINYIFWQGEDYADSTNKCNVPVFFY